MGLYVAETLCVTLIIYNVPLIVDYLRSLRKLMYIYEGRDSSRSRRWLWMEEEEREEEGVCKRNFICFCIESRMSFFFSHVCYNDVCDDVVAGEDASSCCYFPRIFGMFVEVAGVLEEGGGYNHHTKECIQFFPFLST